MRQEVEEMFARRTYIEGETAKMDAYLAARDADHNAGMYLRSLRVEAKEAVAHANALRPNERKRWVQQMQLKWHPGELDSLAVANTRSMMLLLLLKTQIEKLPSHLPSYVRESVFLSGQ